MRFLSCFSGIEAASVALVPLGFECVVIGGKWDGWIVWRHPDGQWVTVQKAEVRDPLESIPDIFKPVHNYPKQDD